MAVRAPITGINMATSTDTPSSNRGVITVKLQSFSFRHAFFGHGDIFSSDHSTIIGPVQHPSYSANLFPTPIQNQLFPLPSLTSRDLLLARPLLPHGESSQFKTWPKVPEDWSEWVDRLEKSFGSQWRCQGLWPLIMLSKVNIVKR